MASSASGGWGLYHVALVPIASVLDGAAPLTAPLRLIFNSTYLDPAHAAALQSLRSRHAAAHVDDDAASLRASRASPPAPVVRGVSPSVWKGVLLNVPSTHFPPGCLGDGGGEGSGPTDDDAPGSGGGGGGGFGTFLPTDAGNAGAQDRTGAATCPVIAAGHVVVVTRRHTGAAPILVLSGVKYRGNVGTIVRSAVQANMFESIYIVAPEAEEGESVEVGGGGSGGAGGAGAGKGVWEGKSVGEGQLSTKKQGGGKKTKAKKTKTQQPCPPILDKDIDYYSMMNAPLMDIRRFASTAAFLSHVDGADGVDGMDTHHGGGEGEGGVEGDETANAASTAAAAAAAAAAGGAGGACEGDGGGGGGGGGGGRLARRIMVGTALTDDSIELFSAEAMDLVQSPSIYMLLGAETRGLPEPLVQRCRCIQIPSLSSSINVSSAFSMVLACMMLGQARREANN